MHAFKLNTLLDAFFWWELHAVADALGLSLEGGRQRITDRVMELHADPTMSTHVARAVRREKAARPPDSKRRKVRDKHRAVADLTSLFDAVADHDSIADLPDYAAHLDRPIGPVVVVGQPSPAEVVTGEPLDTGEPLMVFYPRSMCIDRE